LRESALPGELASHDQRAPAPGVPLGVRQSGRRQRGPGMSSLGSLRTEGPCSAGAL